MLSLLLAASLSTPMKSVWISELDLTKATQGWGTPHVDRSVGNNPITLHGQVFAHGFGTHAPGLLVIKLDRAHRFTATVGIDDESPAGQGAAEFQVLGAAHKPIWTSGLMHRGDPPKSVDVDISGLKELDLRLLTGPAGYTWAHSDWAEARIEFSGLLPHTSPVTTSIPAISLEASSAPLFCGPSIVGVRPGQPVIWSLALAGKGSSTVQVEGLNQGLPDGLKLDSQSMAITGIAPPVGTYKVHLTATGPGGKDKRVFQLVSGQKLALTPPMGWNSYDCFGDNVTEDEILANASYMVQRLKPYGWDTVVVDYRWYDPGAHDNNPNGRSGADLAMDPNGRLLPAPNRFPSAKEGLGFKPLADKIHAMGLKFGIHIMRGIPRNAVKENLPIEGSRFSASAAANLADRCGWCPDMYGVRGASSAGEAYYDSIFRLYAKWGVDYVKMDDTSEPYHPNEIQAVRHAIDVCGRSILYSLSPGETPLDAKQHVADHANLWRVSGDFWDDWTAVLHEFELGAKWRDAAGPGHWPDADMLPFGHLSIKNRSVGEDRHSRFSKAEQVTVMTLWSLLSSPLMVGGNMPDNDPWTLALLTNPEVLAVDQDALGTAAKKIYRQGPVQVWIKDLENGDLAIGVFNLDDFDQNFSLHRANLGLSKSYVVRNLWTRRASGLLSTRPLSLNLPAHGAVLLRLSQR